MGRGGDGGGRAAQTYPGRNAFLTPKEGTQGAARGPRLRALQLPGPCERAFGNRAAASDEGRGADGGGA